MSAEGTPRVKGMAVTAASYPSSPGCLDGRFHELRGTGLVWDTPDATIVLGQDIIQPARRTLPTPNAPHPAPSIHAAHGINHPLMLRRVLVANRGEAAVRLVRACHDLGAEAVAVYSTADSDGLWVGLADRAVCIGPHAPADSYLRVPNLIAAAETTGCDAVHPGWGFLAENAGFVRACQ